MTQMDIIVKAIDRSSSVLKGVGQSGKTAGDDIKRGMGIARDATDKLHTRLQDVDSALDGLDALKTLGSGIGTSFDGGAQSAGALQAQLGLTKDEAQEFGKVAKDVYGNNFSDSLGGATQAVVGVHQALGLTGEDLQNTTEDIFRVSDAFAAAGASPDAITESVRTMKSAFPGKSETEILDIITKGFQDGAGTAGDFQDTLVEYPGYFSDIGLSAKDMSNFLSGGMQNGARNTDLMGDAVKEMGILVKEEGSNAQKRLGEIFGDEQAGQLITNFGKGGDAGRDAFFTMLEGLSKIEDPLERNAAAVDLFGTMGEDLGSSLTDMIPAFLATKDASDDLGGATQGLDAQYAGLPGKIEGAKRSLEMGLTGALGGMVGPANAAVGALGAVGAAGLGLQGMGIDLGSMLGKLPGKILGILPSLGAWLASTWASVAAHIAAAVAWAAAYLPIIAIIAGVIAVVGLLFLAWQTNFLGIQGITFAVWEAIKAAISAAVAFIQPIITNWINNLQVVWNAFWPLLLGALLLAWEGIKLYIQTVLTVIQSIITVALAALKLAWDTFWPLLQAIIETIWPPIRTIIETAINAIKTIVETVVGGIQSFWETVWNAIRDYVQPVWDAIKSVVETVLRAVKAFVEGDLGALRAVWESIWSAIRDFVQPIWDAIKSAVDTTINAIKTIVETVTGGIQSLWETVWGAIKSFAETIWDGIKSYVDTTINAVKTIVDTVVNAIKAIWETVWGAIKTTAETIWDEIESKIDTVINAVKTIIDTVTGQIKSAWETVWGAIKTFVSTIWDGAGGIFNTVKGSIESVKSFIGGVMGEVESAWSGAWGRVKGTVTGIWDEIEGAVRTGINNVIGMINGFIGHFNGLSISIPGFDSGIPGVPSWDAKTISMPNLPLIPSLATGGMLKRDSLIQAHSGEHVINPADGRNIRSLSRALQMAGAGGGGTTVQVNIYGDVVTTDQRAAQQFAENLGFGVVTAMRRRGQA